MFQQPSLSTFTRYALTTLVVAALSACGGGGGADAGAGATAAAASDDGSSGTVSALKVRALAVAATGTAATTTTQLAVEGASFTVTGTQTVQFGAGSSWITMSVTGTGQCTNTFFGHDPIFGTAKTCQLVTTGTTAPVGSAPVTLAAEGGSFTVTGTQTVQFGAGSAWVQMAVTGSGQCTNTFFGKDPAYGIVKSCQLVSTASAAPTVPTVTAWVRIATDGDTLAVANGSTVRYGDGVHWITQVVNSGSTCSVATFGSDPAPWVQKACETQVTAPAVTQTGTMPVINKGLMPGAATSFTTERVRALTAAELTNPVYQPAPSDIGSFREPCFYSHMAFDDPIVYPNQPGLSHLHTFMGNDQTSASSTADSIINSGGSTCVGGTANRTGYWQPTMVDIRTGQPIPPIQGSMYYKLGYYGVQAGQIHAFPKGLRMIAGDASLSTYVPGHARFTCLSSGTWQNNIPSCAVGDTMLADVIFPQCWDGVNLDSPDHKSHMAYGNNYGCPSDHPVAFPEITVRFTYMVTDANTAANWKLSSDNYAGAGGFSLHADWYNGWDTAINATFVGDCLNAGFDCHDYLLGDGRILY